MNPTKSFLQISSSEVSTIHELLTVAQRYKDYPSNFDVQGSGRTGAFLFFEASTRTRMSFELAAHRLGFNIISLEGSKGSSIEKGETLLDTVLNVAAMKPDFMVIRSGDDLDLNNLNLGFPIINAGWGKVEHPSQALLDVLTLKQKWGNLSGKKVLILGDSRYSRVVGSHVELAKKLDYEVRFFGPEQMLRERSHFTDLHEALSWCDAVMALRVQKERHQEELEYSDKYALTPESLKSLKANSWILHPGPMNYGVEVFNGILNEPRSLILKQVENGVYVRMSIISQLLKG